MTFTFSNLKSESSSYQFKNDLKGRFNKMNLLLVSNSELLFSHDDHLVTGTVGLAASKLTTHILFTQGIVLWDKFN